MDNIIAAAILFMAAVLFCVAAAVLGVAGWWFAHAVREAHTARAHGVQADETVETVRAANDALEEIRPPARAHMPLPTDAEIKEALLMQRDPRNNDDDITTDGNEGVPPSPIGADGGIYRTVGNFE